MRLRGWFNMSNNTQESPEVPARRHQVFRGLGIALLTLCCLSGGYTFYRFNNGDWLNAIVFTVGILGILMSVFRQSSSSE